MIHFQLRLTERQKLITFCVTPIGNTNIYVIYKNGKNNQVKWDERQKLYERVIVIVNLNSFANGLYRIHAFVTAKLSRMSCCREMGKNDISY